MKTTKAEFNRFKKAFKYYTQLFGLTDYHYNYWHKPLANAYASVSVDVAACAADVYLASETKHGNRQGYMSAEICAKHEALHVLLAKLRHHALSRHATEEQIENEEEGIVVRLEKVIP